MSPRTKEQIMARIGELERQINTRVAATPLGPLGRRGFPWFSWIAAALGIGLYRFHDLLPLNAAAPFVARHALKLGIAGAAFAVLGLYLTIRFLLQRSVPWKAGNTARRPGMSPRCRKNARICSKS